jgi:hypothetical protein
MASRRQYAAVLVVGGALFFAACSGSGSDESTGTSEASGNTESSEPTKSSSPDAQDSTTTAAPVPTTQPRVMVAEFSIDPETGDTLETEVEQRGPSTLDEVVDEGIASGLWDELQGLTTVLAYAYGAVPAEQVPGVGDILTGELSDVLARANALALSGDYSDDELSELRRWYELAVPSDEVIAMLSSSSVIQPEAAGPPEPTAIQTNSANLVVQQANIATQGSANCVPLDPEDFSDWAVIDGCYEKFEDVVEGVTLQVLYPSWYKDDPALENLPLLAREALSQSTSVYKPLGEIGDVTVVFSLVDTVGSEGTLAVANDTAQWGTATPATGCPISVFPISFTGAGSFQQTIAHETWHCVQAYNGSPLGIASGTAWIREGGAEYFSNVVYPDVNDEHQWLGRFDGDSLTKPLGALSYDAWIWWQFLANRQSPAAVATLQQQMIDAGDGGQGALASYGPTFQRFVMEHMAGTISDANGSKLPRSRRISGPPSTVSKNDEAKILKFEAKPFVAARFAIGYDEQLRVFQSDKTTTAGEFAMVESSKRGDLNAWKQVFPEVRSKCEAKSNFIVVATTDKGTHTAQIQIDRIEEASCDPCMLGTWSLDLDTFGTMIRAAMAAEGGGIPPGTEFVFSGNYYTSLDDKGVMLEQRDGLVVTIAAAGTSFGFTIDSFAQGKYTADGERVSIFDVFEFYADVTTSLPFFDGAVFAQGSSFMGGAGGDYVCGTDDMTVTLDGFEPIRFVRVDKILEPPPLEES